MKNKSMNTPNQHLPLSPQQRAELSQKARAAATAIQHSSEPTHNGALAIYYKAVRPEVVVSLLRELDEKQAMIDAQAMVNAVHMNKAQDAIKVLMSFPEYEEAAQLLEARGKEIASK